MKHEPSTIRRHVLALRRSKPTPFPAAGQRLLVPTVHGVYVIYSPRGTVVHVGRTVTGSNGLRQRLNNHLHGISSFARKHLGGKGASLRKKYAFAYVEVKNARTRALVEALAIGTLCPKHLGVGESAA